MKYVGIQTQIWRNNRNSLLLLLMFPIIILGMVLAFIAIVDYFGVLCEFSKYSVEFSSCVELPIGASLHWDAIWFYFCKAVPWTVGIVGIWFIIAYFANTSIIRHTTHAHPVERKDNLRVYNIVENLCIAGGIEMPKINIIEDSSLNAFASGIDISSYTITLTTGIIDKLNDEELSAVVGHELTHIKNRDTRLMVICIVFVGILSTLQMIIMKIIANMFTGLGSVGRSRRRGKGGGGGIVVIVFVLLVALVVTSIAVFFSWMTRLAISRKREFMADAGGAELCANPLALASALQKISDNPGLGSINRDDVAQLYIIHPDEENDNGKLHGLMAKVNILFCTHPDTPDRIRYLKQF